MKKIIKAILFRIVRAWSLVYSFKLSLRMKGYRDLLYTMWIRNYLGELGKGSSIAYPCSLQGGGQKRIRVGCYTSIGNHGILGCWERYRAMEVDGSEKGQWFEPEILIGDNCMIGEYTQITAINKISIGDGVLTGRYVYIGDNAHGGLSWDEAKIRPARRQLSSKGEVKIGRNVWIGDKVTILAGVTIGDNVIVGANSVVTKHIPSNTMVAGIPAKIIKSLN